MQLSPAGMLQGPIQLTDFSSTLVTPTLSLPSTVLPAASVSRPESLPASSIRPALIPIAAKAPSAAVVAPAKRASVATGLKALGQRMKTVTRALKTGNYQGARASIGALFEGSRGAPAVNFADNPFGTERLNRGYPQTAGVILLGQLLVPGMAMRMTVDLQAKLSLRVMLKGALEGKNNGYLLVASEEVTSGREKTAVLVSVHPSDNNDVILSAKARVEIADITANTPNGPKQATITKIMEDQRIAFGDHSQGQDYQNLVKDIISSLKIVAANHPDAKDVIAAITNSDPVKTVQAILPKVHVRWQHRVLEKDSTMEQLRVLNDAVKEVAGLPTEAGKKEAEEKTVEIVDRIKNANLPEDVEKAVLKELEDVGKTPGPETQKVEQWVKFLLDLPWNERTEDNLDLKRAREILDRDHFGLDKVKERVLEFLAVRKRLKNKKGAILLFTGPPGTGKTSIAKGIAEAMGRKFTRIALGGVSTESIIRGHSRTFTGAKAGVIMETLRRAQSKNPVMVLDELEKMSSESSANGDPTAAMLEVLDPEQNNAFTDHYLDVPFDLSEIIFIATANDLSRIPGPLRDRLEIIEYHSYTDAEKIEIGVQYLDQRGRKETGLTEEEATLTEDGLLHLIRRYTYEAGVRNLTRAIEGLYRKIVARIETGVGFEEKELTAEAIDSLIGPPPARGGEKTNNGVGVASALAVSGAGGHILPIEVNAFPNGKGKIEITGNLRETMEQSVTVAKTVVRARAADLGLEDALFNSMDMLVHVPQGGTPKDGPSAGVTLVTAIASRLTGRAVKSGVAMTGEVYSNGEVHLIGSLKEKVLGAIKNGYTTVLYPKDNETDVSTFSKEVRTGIKLIPVESIEEVLELALEEEPSAEPLRVAAKVEKELEPATN